ncbi:GntR family transcriptional regulator [Amycolatopsis australiensis]|uniref:DNA-binding transcriptional regulator, GntR family n=1 Tax=Amycolatopsis australiensis TaxID=546364 RepID=A0A1K1QU94_9PSEU|nr:GntR family transcriptional regulator [Amycolatopsis australiensis]SFW62878.1 DNA-binding transcriptional regulator, GntR family [Amycolatopsis australiensis]
MVIEDSGGAGLETEHGLYTRKSSAEWAAGILRNRIAEGVYPPGGRLSELEIGKTLRVSRNTLREAFRLLTHERLLVHEFSRGVFVRVPSVEDVVDIYRVRKIIECAAVRGVTETPATFPRIREKVEIGDEAARTGNWKDLGTANVRFHQELAALSGSERVNELVAGLTAELRLVFHIMDEPRRFHERYLPRNHEILDRLEAGDGAGAEQLLSKYLEDAEAQLVEAYADRAEAARTAVAE